MPTDQRWHSDTDREYCSSRAGYAAPADTSSGKYGSGILTMYVCTYIRTLCTYVCTYVQCVMYIRMYVCRCVLGVAFVHVHTSIRTHVSIVHTYVHMHVLGYIYMLTLW